jgi:hypothetical protein
LDGLEDWLELHHATTSTYRNHEEKQENVVLSCWCLYWSDHGSLELEFIFF